MDDPVEVLDYWLDEVGPAGWYAGGAALDADIREKFGDLWLAASEGKLDHWIDGPAGTLAFLILTDQMSRNMFRDTAAAFSTDARARDGARTALESGWDLQAPEPERQFFYLPFEHSEDPEDQALSVALFEMRMPDTGAANLLHARAHREVIGRYGRFPTRNLALGRENTPDESLYLENGGYGAIVQLLQE